jgi:hypothetical protein
MTVIEGIGYTAAATGVAMIAMQTMIPLRLTGIAHNICSIVFGLLAGVYPTVIQHTILLPLNTLRLFEMMRLIKQVKAARAGDFSVEWLRPFMTRRQVHSGEILFRKGDDADHMYLVLDGHFHLVEINIDVVPGTVVGELGMLSPNGKRTQTLVCAEAGTILEIAYERIEEIYYQNPTFGFYFLRLSAARLFENINRLELLLATRDAEVKHLRATLPSLISGRASRAPGE